LIEILIIAEQINEIIIEQIAEQITEIIIEQIAEINKKLSLKFEKNLKKMK